MGVYVQVRDPLQRHGKAATLEEELEAVRLDEMPLMIPGGDEALICVVENGGFDAALLCYEQADLDRVLYSKGRGDDRPTTFLVCSRQAALAAITREEQRVVVREAWWPGEEAA